MTFSEGDRVKFLEPSNLRGTVTADKDPWFDNFTGVRWDDNDFAFVDPRKITLADPIAIPGMSEADRASLAEAHRMALDAVAKITGQNRTEPGTDLVDWQARAEQAEATIAQVRTLAVYYDRHDRPRSVHRFNVAKDLHAILGGRISRD